MERTAHAFSDGPSEPQPAPAPVGRAAALLLAVAGFGRWPARTGVQLPDFTELVERVGPAVVNIRTLERGGGQCGRATANRPQRGGVLPPLRHPAAGGRDPPAPRPRGGGDDEPQQRGVGSGFILSADGYIMTNAHVVDGADEVMVTLTDKREFKARIIGADKRTDVAW
jgi:serine protease Do